MPQVVIVDYGMGNLDSIRRAMEECGASVMVADRPEALSDATHIIIPGVGAFPDGMRHLEAQGMRQGLEDQVMGKGIPVLGICLGMQLMATIGTEVERCPGLAWLPGEVRRLEPAGGEKVPHVGWNEVRHEGHPLFEGIPVGTDFYFVHSFRICSESPADVIATTPYAGGFVSAVARGPVLGVQFHPEKSQVPGFRLLRNFLAWNGP